MFKTKSKEVISKTDNLKKISKKNLLSRYIILLISLFVSSCCYNLLQLPSNIVSGGTGGIAMLTKELFAWNPSTVILILSVVLLLLSALMLGFEKTSGALISTFVYPIFVDLTSNIGDFISVDISDTLIIAIFLGVIGGVTSGINYRIGFNGGGFNILSQIFYKYFRISISKSTLLMNSLIVIGGGMLFGWTMVMYSIILLYISNIMLDKVLLGISTKKTFYIIAEKEDSIKDYIINELNHGVTVFPVQGGLNLNKKRVLMTVIPTSDYFKLTEGVKSIDEKAFFVVVDSYQTYGGA